MFITNLHCWYIVLKLQAMLPPALKKKTSDSQFSTSGGNMYKYSEDSAKRKCGVQVSCLGSVSIPAYFYLYKIG